MNTVNHAIGLKAQHTADSKAQVIIAPLADEAAVLALLKDGDTWVIDETGAEKLVKNGAFVDKVGGSQNVYSDADFKILDSSDGTKAARFENSTNVPTATEVVVHMPSEDVFLEDLVKPTTATPSLSYSSTVNEGTPLLITISNYDAGYDYVLTGNEVGSVVTRTDDVISYTSSDVAVDTAVNLSVTAQDTVNDHRVSFPAVAAITVLFLTLVDDTTDTVGADDGILLYQGADMVDTYYDRSEKGGVRGQKLKTSKVAYNAIAYTGNGTSQDIVNDIEMNLDGRVVDKLGGQVWIKDRSVARTNNIVSTVVGSQYELRSDSTVSLQNDTHLTQFNSNGFEVGNFTPVNNTAETYVSWNQGTTKYSNGYTNHGKFYEIEFNPLTGFFQGVYEGSGITGHEIPHMMGVAPDFFSLKRLDNAANWQTYQGNENETMELNTTDASYASAFWNNIPLTSSAITLGSAVNINGTTEKYYFYGFANTAGKVKVGTYTGTGAAGNAITGLGFQPGKLITKATSAASSWAMQDSKRTEGQILYADLSNSEGVSGTPTTFDVDGFTVNGGGTEDNVSGYTYMYIAIADHDDFETTLYTGNGTTQDIVTGLNMDVKLSAAIEANGALNPSTVDVVPAMTSDALPAGYIAYSSAIFAGQAYYSFDNNVATDLILNTAPATLAVKVPSAFVCNKFTMSSRDLNSFPADSAFTVEGSNDATGSLDVDGTWVELGTLDTGALWGTDEERTFTFSNTVSYSVYRLKFPTLSTSAYISLNQVQFIEAQGTIEHAKIPGGLSWIKGRNIAENHALFDTVRGANKHLRSDQTAAEQTLAGALTNFNTDGFTLGGTNQQTSNVTAYNYASWSWGTTHEYSGVTNHGKPYTCAFNPISGFTIVKYTGSGTAGHEIPHHLGRALDITYIKNLNSVTSWRVHSPLLEYDEYVVLDQTSASVFSSGNIIEFGSDSTVLTTSGASNSSGVEHIMYGWANSMTQEVIEYTGTGVAGNFISTKEKPGYVMIKRLDGADNWITYDSERGSTESVYLNSTIAEISLYPITFANTGIILEHTNGIINASGGQYLAFVMYDTDETTNGSEFY